MHRRDSIEPNKIPDAAIRIRLNAEQGDAKAQYDLGHIYYHGEGVRQDYAQAARWYHKAADQGYAKAQYGLGYMYSHAQGVPQDFAAAVRWYQKAADQGVTKAQVNLAAAYYHGEGVPQDYAEAVRLYAKQRRKVIRAARRAWGLCTIRAGA